MSYFIGVSSITSNEEPKYLNQTSKVGLRFTQLMMPGKCKLYEQQDISVQLENQRFKDFNVRLSR